ncbi:PREDICTED: N-acetylgalactosamine kinase-like isoform X2 [Polistes dominula]|uniref:N-acetylgalactosamine kinase-like isoform X2 n=1 Tax=Polistes dominula TaxID=743375 RepID=A0ABM1JGF2_POLDO|nr:PREDICTED: N-acetylgalactosamine kinase-like isoform X2 [Polistes dominula]
MSNNANGENEFSETKDGVSVLKADEAFSLKLKILSEHFIQKYNREPTFVVKVPGRVNLIGEHIDYCGYAVCPMAIKQHILIAVGISNDHRISVTNVNSNYQDFSCDFDNVKASIDDSKTGPIWYKYYLCGILGALDVIPKEKVPKGILAAVWGNVPANAGLSSSSALVSASVLSLFHASQIIAKKRNKNWKSVMRLIDLQESLGFSLEEMVSVVMEDLHEEAYTMDEICECLSTTYERLKESSQIANFNTTQMFKLQQRALHVFQEANRVIEFQRINNDDTLMEDVKVRLLGELMSKSHLSLCKLYECSHPRVDALVDKAINCGALGARITGAGWGGCIVAIILKDNISQFVEKIRKYLSESCTTNGLDLEDSVFPTEPNQGATIYVL